MGTDRYNFSTHIRGGRYECEKHLGLDASALSGTVGADKINFGTDIRRC